MSLGGAAIILGGGRSSRIGQDKCFLKLGGRPVLDITLDRLGSLFKEIIFVTNTPELVHEDYRLKIATDEIPHQGPLGGILAGLSSSSKKYNLVVACDMPFLNVDLIKFLFKETSDADVVIPCSEKGIEPLHAVYSQDCVPVIREKLASGKKRVISFFDEVKVKYIPKEKVREFDPDSLAFFNVNTLEDVELAQKAFESSKGS